MRSYLMGLASLALLVGVAAPAAAQPSTHQPQRQQAAQKQQPRAAQQQQNRNASSRYGTWNRSWGAQPPAPPKHWTRTSDWYRHVRACQQKFRSYNARTDSYRTRSGQTRRCTL